MSLREWALKIAFAYIGKWYKWGGDDPSGFDCSGFVVEVLQSVGLIGRKEDLTAAALWDRFENYPVRMPEAGCLVFWENDSGRVIHVEMAISHNLAIGASGGGSKTLTEQDAIRHNAFIKVRPIASRSGVKGFLNPWEVA